MTKKILLAILIILFFISVFLAVMDIYQKPFPEQVTVPRETKQEPLPDSGYVIPEYPAVTDETKTGQPALPKETLPVAKVITKDKLPVSKDQKKQALPVTKELKKEEAPAVREEAPVAEETKKEKAPPVTKKSPEEISSLQEKCEKMSGKIFRKEYKDGVIESSKGIFLYKYNSHYNKKLNKCFMVVTEDGDLERYKKLLDVEENESYGSVRVNNDQENLGCYVRDKKCKSEDGWDSIVKPYMEE